MSILNQWKKSAKGYSDLASSKERDAFEYEVNVPSLFSLCPEESKKVLDVGCGSGEFTKLFTEKYSDLVASDGAPEMLEIARKNNPDMHFFLWNLEESFPLKDEGEYDLVISKLVLMFVEDLSSFAKVLRGILSDGGVFVCSVIHPAYWLYKYVVSVERKKGDVPSQMSDGYFTKGFIRENIKYSELDFDFIHRTVSEYINPFIEAGFSLDVIDEPQGTKSFVEQYPDEINSSRVPRRLNIRFKKCV